MGLGVEVMAYISSDRDYLVTGSLCAISDPRIRTQSQHILEALSELNNLSREDLVILLLTKIARE
jgi:hypothetical protein